MADRKPVVGFAGMSHLGLVSGAGAAEKGFRVIGFDPDPARIAELRAGRLPVVEPGLDDLVARHAGQFSFTDDANDLSACDLVFVARDVPTDDRGESDLGPVRDLLNELSSGLRDDAVLTVMCQVPPGFTRSLSRGPDTLAYLVETLIFGEAVSRTLNPERFIVGLADGQGPVPPALADYMGAYCCPILPMRYESAELGKISINLFLAASVTTTNTIAEVCEAVGADWEEIAPALRLDKRIGPHAYLAPGLGISGGNIERDMTTLIAMSERFGTDAGAICRYVENSRYRKQWPLRTLASEVLTAVESPRIAMLGLAYKANSDSVKNSPALDLLASLRGFEVSVHDPLVAPQPGWHDRMTHAATALACAADADALVVMTPWDEYRQLDAGAVFEALRGNVVIDPYRILDGPALKALGVRYFCLGADLNARDRVAEDAAENAAVKDGN